MKKGITIIITVAIIVTILSGCSNVIINGNSESQPDKTSIASFEGSWEMVDDMKQVIIVEGNNARFFFAPKDSNYSQTASFSFSIIEKNSSYYLYENGKVLGEIKHLSDDAISVSGLKSFDGTYNAIETPYIG